MSLEAQESTLMAPLADCNIVVGGTMFRQLHKVTLCASSVIR